jgi:hypothetical protein
MKALPLVETVYADARGGMSLPERRQGFKQQYGERDCALF